MYIQLFLYTKETLTTYKYNSYLLYISSQDAMLTFILSTCRFCLRLPNVVRKRNQTQT